MSIDYIISSVHHYWRNFITLLKNPSSIWFAFYVCFQLFICVSISAIVPFILRNAILPSSIQQEIPLNLIFSPCTDNLHGVCSYPTAVVDVKKLGIFSPSVTYSLAIRLHFADIEANSRMGLFQNKIAVLGIEDQIIGEWYKSAYIRVPSIFVKLLRVMFFPFYFFGFFHDYHSIEIFFADDFLVPAIGEPLKLIYTLQDKFPQVETASLLINARFGLLRYLVYHWPIITYVIMFLITLSVCVSVLVVYYGHKMYIQSKSEDHIKLDGTDPPPHVPVQEKPKPASSKTQTPSPDEYIPDNVDEIPECPVFNGIPGWNDAKIENKIPRRSLSPTVNTLRKRKQ